jgi:hypothetical protein
MLILFTGQKQGENILGWILATKHFGDIKNVL